MNRILILFFLFVSCTIASAQKKETITVKAGTSLVDYVDFSDQYLYPEFTMGIAFMNTGIYSQRKFNYNYLNGEVEFIAESDTMAIGNKKDVALVVIERDTFYFDNGYILQIRNGMLKIGVKDHFEFKNIEKKDPYGVSSTGGATTSYSGLPTTSYSGLPTTTDFYKLKANQDLIYERSKIYYVSRIKGDFLIFNKRNIYQLFPDEKNQIKSFIKSGKIKFDNQKDLNTLADYIESL